jgi:hypothetical protein
MALRLVDKIAGIYDASPLLSIVVPEWGNEKIYYKLLTGEEYDTAQKELDAGTTGARNNAQLIVLKSLDANGVRVFENADAELLYQKGYVDTFGRLAKKMTRVISPEDAEKN